MLHFKRTLSALVTSVALLLVAASAQAIPYFNGPGGFGFDNSTLMLTADIVIDPDFTPLPIAAGDPGNLIGLAAVDTLINDTLGMIDRTIDWTLTNNDPANVTDVLVVFTALGPNSSFFSNAMIDLQIDGVGIDPMDIASVQLGNDTFFFAAYRLTSADFNASNIATRRFRYTVDLPEGPNGPPELGLMLIDFSPVPEPASGVLLGGALLLALASGRRRSL